MRGLLDRANKKAISLMIGYIVLVVIGLTMSVLVFSFLKVYVIKDDKPTCTKDVTIIAEDIKCTIGSNELSFTITNKGLFSAKAIYVRMSSDEPGKRIPKELPRSSISPVPPGGCNIPKDESHFFEPPVKPGESPFLIYCTDEITSGGATEYTLEIEPAVEDDDELILCPQFTITQRVTCS